MATSTKVENDKDYLLHHGKELSDTTKRAKWISGTGEHQDHDGQTLATRNHDVIRQWAKERDAAPVTIEGTEHLDRPGVLRFDFPGYASDGKLESVDWDKWFQSFDSRELVFDYQEKLKDGRQSNFFILDNPHRERG
jgi:hypothetical protein